MNNLPESYRHEHVKPVLKFKTADLQQKLEALCTKVIGEFTLSTAQGRLLCFLDDEDPPLFTSRFGTYYRGFHTPIRDSGIWPWPEYVQRYFWNYDGNSVFDNIVYLRGDTCKELAGTAITLAHGLYHFVLYYNSPELWWANALLYSNLADFEQFRTPVLWDIPAQKGAYVAAKQIACSILGPEIVQSHVNTRIKANDDPVKWTFIQDLPPAEPFDLLTATRRAVDKYKPQLLEVRQTKLDFTKSEWWIPNPNADRAPNIYR